MLACAVQGSAAKCAASASSSSLMLASQTYWIISIADSVTIAAVPANSFFPFNPEASLGNRRETKKFEPTLGQLDAGLDAEAVGRGGVGLEALQPEGAQARGEVVGAVEVGGDHELAARHERVVLRVDLQLIVAPAWQTNIHSTHKQYTWNYLINIKSIHWCIS